MEKKNAFTITRARPEDAAALLDYLKIVGGETDNLSFGAEGVPLAPEEETWRELLEGLRKKGADYFILGCTELPIVADSLPVEGPFIDPTAELAKAAIRFCGYGVRGE